MLDLQDVCPPHCEKGPSRPEEHTPMRSYNLLTRPHLFQHDIIVFPDSISLSLVPAPNVIIPCCPHSMCLRLTTPTCAPVFQEWSPDSGLANKHFPQFQPERLVQGLPYTMKWPYKPLKFHYCICVRNTGKDARRVVVRMLEVWKSGGLG